ncbi:mitochondrial amidoxime reducing component 2-like isoform X2 [Anopheles maculipalpis]|uniref:mitochondrial amidoxime reducing component 2-like isoform X2 n=1 Tax=Anopheles maculipalpis TaxID=1496333 RepID=UPI002158F3A8|nr:mitochondrial amidoxime reducing component 2-like isoform X2 [Anopheles maculipalpis]
MIDFCSIPLTFRHHREADGLSEEMLSKLLNNGGAGGTGGKPTAGQLLAVAAGIGAATALGYGVYRLLKYRAEQRPPTEWHRVGEVSDLWIYPIKSCGAVRMRQFQCSPIGPQLGLLRDRIFMVVKSEDGKFITGRSHPTLVLVQPAFDEQYERMTLSAPGMMDIVVNVKQLLETVPGKFSVWDQPVAAVDCGEEVARWLSRFILSEDFGLRLVYYPLECPTRPVREKNRIHALLTARDSGALHDATSYMLVSEASVADVNSRLEKPVPALQYRANILVKGPGAFEEDNWKWIRIGETVYRNVKPCTRCLFTNVDPETGVSNPAQEPLNTLRKYRLKPGLGSSPVVGMQMGIRTLGSIGLGDTVYVG